MTQTLNLTKPLSAAMLERADACPDQVALVRKHFGSRPFRLTRKRLRQAARLWLDIDWLATHLRPKAQRAYYVAAAKAQLAYDVAMAAAKAQLAYDVAMAVAEAQLAYYVAAAKAQLAYDVAVAEARRAYRVARAEALADALGLP